MSMTISNSPSQPSLVEQDKATLQGKGAAQKSKAPTQALNSSDQLMQLSSGEALSKLETSFGLALIPGAGLEAGPQLKALLQPLLDTIQAVAPPETVGEAFAPDVDSLASLQVPNEADAAVFSAALLAAEETPSGKRVELVKSFVRAMHSEWNKKADVVQESAQQQLAQMPQQTQTQIKNALPALVSAMKGQGATKLPTVSSGALGGIDWADPNLDIDTLVFLVMMECSQEQDAELREQMAEMDKINQQKAQLRSAETELKAQQLAVESDMRVEYDQLMKDGKLSADVSFDDYKSWRQVSWGGVVQDAAGNYSVSGEVKLVKPMPPLPEDMRADHSGKAPDEVEAQRALDDANAQVKCAEAQRDADPDYKAALAAIDADTSLSDAEKTQAKCEAMAANNEKWAPEIEAAKDAVSDAQTALAEAQAQPSKKHRHHPEKEKPAEGGGHKQEGTLDQLAITIEETQNQLDALSATGEEAMMRLQMTTTARQQIQEALSALMKKSADTVGSIIANLK